MLLLQRLEFSSQHLHQVDKAARRCGHPPAGVVTENSFIGSYIPMNEYLVIREWYHLRRVRKCGTG